MWPINAFLSTMADDGTPDFILFEPFLGLYHHSLGVLFASNPSYPAGDPISAKMASKSRRSVLALFR